MPKTIISQTSDMSLVVEEGHFIVDRGNLFCVRATCEGCSYEDTCTKLEGEDFLEAYINKATRDNIRLGKVNTNDWIAINPPRESLKDFDLKNKQYILQEGGESSKKISYLALKDVVVYKKIDLEVIGKLEDFFIYKEEDRTYYCMKPCSGCKYEEVCNPIMIEKASEKSFVAIDSSSQEPQIIAYLSKEPRYIDIFKNNSIKDIPYLYQPISWVLEDVIGLSPDSQEGAKFIDYIGFKDKTLLYKLATTFYQQIEGDYSPKKVEDIVEKITKKHKLFQSET